MYQNGKNITFTDRSVDSVNAYLCFVSKTKPLSTEDEHSLWLRMQQGSRSAREKLITANLAYVISVAKKYNNSKAPFADLIQAGNEGLVKAVDKFDASLGFRLISFATWYIENEVRKAAYNYIKNNHTSLDKSIDVEDEEDGAPLSDFVSGPIDESADWNLRYNDALKNLASRVDKRQYGLGHLTTDLHQMLLDGYTTSDFARKHHLNETQMSRLLTILYEEATHHLSMAA